MVRLHSRYRKREKSDKLCVRTAVDTSESPNCDDHHRKPGDRGEIRERKSEMAREGGDASDNDNEPCATGTLLQGVQERRPSSGGDRIPAPVSLHERRRQPFPVNRSTPRRGGQPRPADRPLPERVKRQGNREDDALNFS